MIFYHLDLYPRTDPKDGVLIRRLSDLQREEIRASANGTGSAVLAMRGTSDDAEALSPDGLEYLRVVRENTDVVDGATLSGHDEKCVHGLFLDSPGDYLALSRERKQLLTLNATGTLAYLEREVMWSHTYLDGVGAMDPFDRIWRLYAAGDWSGGNHLGAMLWRVMVEALAFQSGAYQHRHADGATYTDTHPDDDKLESAVGAVTLTFDQFEDSSGNPWTKTSGDFIAQVGETILAVVRRLVALGLYVYLDPDTFELSAWEIANHGRVRTGAAWATDVIRFQAPIGQAIETGNIKSDAVRGTTPRVRRTAILAGGGDDIYGTSSQAGDVPWHGFQPSDAADVAALEAAATRELGARNDAADTARIRLRLGNDPENGAYLPLEAEGVLLDDRATVNSGALAWDWDEQTLPVAGVVLRHRRGGDWECFVDLGSSFTSAASRTFQGPQTGAHTHPPNPRICRDTGNGWTLPIEFLIKQRWDVGAGDLAHRDFAVRFRNGVDAPWLSVFWDYDFNADATDAITLYVRGQDQDVNDTGFDTAVHALAPADGIDFLTRFRIEADTVMARCWAVGDAEPGTWQVSASGGGFLLTDAAVATLNRMEDAFNSQFPDPTTFWQDTLTIVSGYGPSGSDTFSTPVGSGNWGNSEINGALWEVESSVNAGVTGGEAFWTAANLETAISSQLIIPAAVSTCIHGGPAANSGDASVPCGKCVAAGNHEHDYVASGGTTGQVPAKASDADWDTEWVDLPGIGGSFFVSQAKWMTD